MNLAAVDHAGAAATAAAVPDDLRLGYALRRVPRERIARLLPLPPEPRPGDVAVALVETLGRNTSLEKIDGRRSTLHPGAAIGVVFGNRYATKQFEGYAKANGDQADLLSMGGLCGLVSSRHAAVPEPTRLRLLGAAADAEGRRLNLRDFSLPAAPPAPRPRLAVVCGSSMDAGKTHTVMSVLVGLRRTGRAAAGVKLTGTAAGSDTWALIDAGALAAFDFLDGGYPSTYLVPVEELIGLRDLLVAHAAARGASWVVMEIADGLLQRETSALLRSPRFVGGVDAWLFATGDPLAAAGGVDLLRNWGIRPAAVSGLVSQSPLCVREVQAATGLPCLTAAELQGGRLNAALEGV